MVEWTLPSQNLELLPDGRPQNKQPWEGWHNKINRAVGKAHPNIFELVELFKTEQANTEVSLAQLAPGGAVRNTRSTAQNRRDLQKKEKSLNRGTIH